VYQVFIVEDHPMMQAAYTEMIKSEGDMQICGLVSSAEEAIDLLQTLKVDLVIVDLSLPGMHGTDLIRYLRSAYPGLPALMVSGHPLKQYEALAKAVGAAGYVDKADAAYTLIPTIRAILAPYAG
jgi:DNA-binding NarL/FixJ family response regulator